MDKAMVLVTGAGRSGTSTAAGTLSRLGLHVPGPFLQANESNPKGFYESRWSVGFHNRLLKRAHVALADSRPDAGEIVRAAVRPRDRERLRTWLADASRDHQLVALKDPRTTWTLDLWWDVAAELGISLRFLTMLRHPAEVVGSRATHYSRGVDALGARGFATTNLAGWVNAMLLTEGRTRGRPRAFVHYDNLLDDWRSTMADAAQTLDLDLEPDDEAAAAVDAFIDPALSRHRVTWSDVDVPAGLQEIAEEVWRGCDRLAAAGGVDDEATAALDRTRERYAQMYRDAQQLTTDATSARVRQARAEVEREVRARDALRPAEDRSVRAMASARRARAAFRTIRRRLSDATGRPSR